MQAQNEFSTVHTEAFFGNLGSFATTLGRSLQDKKLTIIEGIDVAIAAAPFGTSVTSFKGMTLPEIKDIYQNEVENVVQNFAKKFDLQNDKVEVFIVDCIRYALSGVALYNSGKDLFSSQN